MTTSLVVTLSRIRLLLEQYQALQLSEVIDYERLNQYAITHHSTCIEGSTLTLTETRLLLEQQLPPKGKPIGHSLMVQDHYSALHFILAAAKEQKNIDISFIKAINAQVLRQTGTTYRTVFGDLNSNEGVFRKANVTAVGRYFPNYAKVEMLCTELVIKVQKLIAKSVTIEEQLLLSFDVHFDFVSIHPFYDGNGRTSRLLMNYIQALFGLPLAIVFSDDKSDYFDALEATREQENLDLFRVFMLGQYEKFLVREIGAYQAMKESGKRKGGGFSLVF